MPAGTIGVGPWLESLLPQGIRGGDVALVYGETGAGATTLALTIAAHAAGYGDVIWYSARGCEPRQQLLRQMKRLNAWHPNQAIADGVELETVLDDIRVERPVLAVIDRLQDLVDWMRRKIPAAYEAIAEVAAQTGTAVWINSAIAESRRADLPWGLTAAARPAHLYRIDRQHDGVDPNPLVVTDKRTGRQVVLDLGGSGLVSP